MEYVIFDLEWNNAYDYKQKKGINEIIEIGAVRLNRNLDVVDTYKQLIKPKLSRKLSQRFVELTSITKEEIASFGIPFENAMRDFARWSAGNDVVFMSWSNSDLYVLVSNYKRFLGKTNVSFMKKYLDAQKYCQNFVDNGGGQISLAHCAQRLDINIEEENLHRALEDCYAAAECFKKVFSAEKVKPMISVCSNDFFGRLAFKPYYIKEPVTSEYNVYKEVFECPQCGRPMKRLSEAQIVNTSFKTVYGCKSCSKKFWCFSRAKMLYDGVSVAKRTVEMSKHRAKNF